MKRQNSKLYLLVVMGMLSAFGPFVTDFYLPALPQLSTFFGTSAPMAQLSLTVCMIGLALGQLVVGPLSDRYGRKGPLLCSLALFLVSTAGCLYAPTIRWFVIGRLLQGIAGAGGVVLSKSIATDLYNGKELAGFFAMLVSVQGIAPIGAPVLGGLMLGFTDWHGIFYALFILGVVLLFAAFRFRESLHPENRLATAGSAVFSRFIPVFRNRGFMQYVMIQTFAMGVMFTYIAASPFIFQQHYGLSPLGYSLCFALNALGIMFGGLLVPVFKDTGRTMVRSIYGFTGLGLATALFLIAELPVWWVEASLFVTLVFLGMILPTSTSLAMDMERQNAGKASAILGSFQFLLGGILSPIAGMGNIFAPTGSVIAGCCLCTFFGLLRLRKLGLRGPTVS